jgi:BMFP domain-containing protein YqiC
MANESIDKLARKLAESVPQGLHAVRAELEQNFRAVLKSGLSKLDLVTREEFEVQEAVLRRTRAKLEALETRLDALEAKPPKKTAAKKPASKKTAKKKRSASSKTAGGGEADSKD